MSSTSGSIKDYRIRLIPSKELLKFIHSNIEAVTELPQNVKTALEHNGYDIPKQIAIIEYQKKSNKLNFADLREKLDIAHEQEDTIDSELKITFNSESQETHQTDAFSKSKNCFYLDDLHWLRSFCNLLRQERGLHCYMHEFVKSCQLILPQNEIVARNPVLEERCQKLREEQQKREYRKMTKNVDSVLKNYPEDTIAYQLKAINSQIIAVLQFVLSVVAGFVFGFLGVNLIFGNLDFGFRLLLGIMCALIIALAEIYFLAKKLNEIDDATSASTSRAQSVSSPAKKQQKAHTD